MSPQFDAFRADYAHLWQAMKIHDDRIPAVDAIARRLISNKSRYRAVTEVTKVPWFIVAAIHEREASANFHRHLHNGDPLSARTYHVPAGRPLPPAQPPFTWEESAADALALSGLTKVGNWSVERTCYEIERYNGFGYRRHGINSPYLWSFSNNYSSGKYVADGQWSSSAVDAQCGVMPLLQRMKVADLSIVFDGTPSELPAIAATDAQLAPATTPTTDATVHSVEWLQRSLNALGAKPELVVDGDYGPSTKRAVRWFQHISDLPDDGKAGPVTYAAIERRLAAATASAQAAQAEPAMAVR